MPNSSEKTHVVIGRSGQPVRSPPGAQRRLLPKCKHPRENAAHSARRRAAGRPTGSPTEPTALAPRLRLGTHCLEAPPRGAATARRSRTCSVCRGGAAAQGRDGWPLDTLLTKTAGGGRIRLNQCEPRNSAEFAPRTARRAYAPTLATPASTPNRPLAPPAPPRLAPARPASAPAASGLRWLRGR